MHPEPVTLEGQVVRLEPLSLDHLDALAAFGLHPDIWRFTTTQIRTREELKQYLETALQWQRDGTAIPFVTVLREGNRVIGSTRFANIDRDNRKAEIGWTWLDPELWRSGANTEAKLMMLQLAFESWKCIRVELKTSALNERSRAAIRRIGAKEEGILRQHMINQDGSYRDTVYHSILDRDWPEVKEKLTRMLRPRLTLVSK